MSFSFSYNLSLGSCETLRILKWKKLNTCPYLESNPYDCQKSDLISQKGLCFEILGTVGNMVKHVKC